jgi:4-alpha-glucanotransferase
MNRPGAVGGNWDWRFTAGALQEDVRKHLRDMTYLYGREVKR